MTRSTAPLGLVRFSAYDLVPMSVAHDVPVLPTTGVRRTLNNGGPVLHDWEHQHEARHGRNGAIMPSTPPDMPDEMPYMDESMIWGGYVERHFGHLICEYTTRILPALAQRPDDRLLFALWPGAKAEDANAAFWAVLDWYGVSRDRVVLVEQPMTVRDLWIAPQPEQHHGLSPSYQFLELLAENTTARGLVPIPDGIVYVTRAQMIERNLAKWVGEDYLVEKLQGLGVTVMAPEDHPLQHQLAVYAGAEKLVFAEGSAAHGRQLLGFYDQEITILARRPNARLGMNNLLPRCRMLNYGEVTQGLIRMVFHDGTFDLPRALSVYDTENLFRNFDALGVPLRDVWDHDELAERTKPALLSWLQAQFNQVRQQNKNFDWDKSIAQVRQDLRRQGFDYVFPEANFWLKRKEIAS